MKYFVKSLLLFTILSSLCLGADLESQLDEILNLQQKYFQKYYTIKCDSNFIVQVPEALAGDWGTESGHLNVKSSFINAGNNFRAETQTIAADNSASLSLITAYNGKQHQMLQLNKDIVLDLSSKPIFSQNPYGNMHPLLTAFTWAFSENDSIDLDITKLPDFWSKLRDNTVEVHREEKNGYPCIAWTFKSGDGNLNAKTNKVFFAENMNFFPVYSEIRDSKNQLRSRCTATKLEKVVVEGIEIVFPFQVEGKTYFGPDANIESACHLTINPETLRINEPIEPDVFTIARSRADYIFDRDLNTWLKNPKPTFGTSTAELLSKPSNTPPKNDIKKENVSSPQEKNSIENSEMKTVDDDELTEEPDKVNLPKQNWYKYIGFTLISLSCLSIIALILLKRRGNRSTDCSDRE